MVGRKSDRKDEYGVSVCLLDCLTELRIVYIVVKAVHMGVLAGNYSAVQYMGGGVCLRACRDSNVTLRIDV